MPGAGRRAKLRSSASPISTESKGRRSTRSPSAPFTPASSSRGISASSATANRSFTWRFRSATSIAASNGRSSAARTSGRFTLMETVAGDTSVGHATAYCQVVESSGRLPGPGPCRGAARHRPGAGTAGQPHRRPGRPGRRRGVPADRLVLRPNSRRLPEPDRPAVRQPFRPRHDPARRRRLRPRRRPSGAVSGTPGGGVPGRDERGQSALEFVVGAGPLRGHGGGFPRCLRRPWAWSVRRPGPAAWSATSAKTSRPASSVSRRCRFPPGRPATSSPVLTSAGWKSSGPWRSSRISCTAFPTGRSVPTSGSLTARSTAWSLVEGWRGEICHVALTDDAGPVRALQDRGPVVPQLDRPGDGAARPADFRLSAVQQELQPVVLRARFVSLVSGEW